MRYISILVLLLICSMASAQKISIGLRTGVAVNTSPFKEELAIMASDAKGVPSVIAGVRGTVDFKHFQAGVGVDYSFYKYHYTMGFSESRVTTPYAFPYLFGNYKINLRRSFVFVGIMTGVTIWGSEKYFDVGSGQTYVSERNKAGLSAGVQAGYNLSVAKKWNVQVEVGARSLPIKAGVTHYDGLGNPISVQENNRVFAMPITLGVNYRL